MAKDPTVNGLGFAAVRDFNSFLKYSAKDDFGTANPLCGPRQADLHRDLVAARAAAQRFPAPGLQRGRERQQGLDGLMQWVAAGDGINMNYRFSQTGPHRAQPPGPPVPRRAVPVRQPDDVSIRSRGQTDGRYKKCEATNTCPLAMEIYSSNEYWVKAASLFHTDPDGHAGPQGSSARAATISCRASSTAAPAMPTAKGNCQQFAQSARFGAGAARAVRGAGRVVDEGQEAAGSAGADAQGRHARVAAAAGQGRASRTFRA